MSVGWEYLRDNSETLTIGDLRKMQEEFENESKV